MARPLRLELAGGLYHVTSRGDRGEDIYRDDEDREAWLRVFAGVCERYNWRCHAYCLMPNHYHVVVETSEANLSRGMRQLNGVFTQDFNRRHDVAGHLFQGRFKAILVERDAYLLELARYVVLNPVRAGMARRASDWPWSSYRATAGDAPRLKWLETDWILRQFGRAKGRARERYAEFVTEGLGGRRIWDDLRYQVFLGGDDFVARFAEAVKPGDQSREVTRAQRRPFVPSLAAFEKKHKTHKQAMVAAYLSGAYTLQEVAEHFGVHYATVSRAVKAHELAMT